MADGPGTTPTTSSSKNREDVLNLVRSRFEHSQNYHQTYFARTRRWYDLYRGVTSKNFQQFRNNIHIPFIFSVIQSDVARKVQTSLGAWPIVSFAGYGIDDASNARRNEILISAQMKDANAFTKAVKFFLNADLYGTAICRVGWRTMKQMQKFRHLIPGTNQEIVIDDLVTKFDGPDFEVSDILDEFPQPGICEYRDMGWNITRYWKDLDAMKAMSIGEDPYYIPEAITELEQFPSTQTQTDLYNQRWSQYRNSGERDARTSEKHAKPVEIKEMWGLVPDEFALNGIKLVVIAMANDRVIVKYDAFPFWHGDLSQVFIKYCPMPDPHYFHGTGMAEICEKLAVTANRLASQKLDALEVQMDPMWLVSEQAGIQGPIFTRAGKMIQVNGMVDDSMIRPVVQDFRGMEHAYPEISTLWGYMQQGTGIAESEVMGLNVSGGDRQTAREFLGRQENALTRIALSSRLAEEGWLEPLANAFRSLNRQYLTLPHTVKILGPTAMVNPITGMSLPPEPTVVDLEDVNPDYRARAVGATQMLSKSARKQDYLAFTQIATSNPVGLQIINWMAWLREGAHLFDFHNVNELFKQQVPAVNSLAQAQGQSPEAMLGSLAGSPLPDLNGDVLQQQFPSSLTGTLGG